MTSTSEYQVIETTHEMPMPFRPEAEIVKAIAETNASFAAAGGTVVSVRRHRNPVFDRKGERTSTTFVVKWPSEPTPRFGPSY